MKLSFYSRLAWSGITKNRKLYLPYILSCIGMVMMFYIISALSFSPLLVKIKGGNNLVVILSLGKFVVAAFAALFLFYTNSFIIRRRFKEFGLYNVLGLDKRNICRVMTWESLIVSAFGLGGGTIAGIAFSKLAELGLLNAIHEDVNHSFTVSGKAISFTVAIFGIIFLLLLIRSVRRVRKYKTVELVRSENAGEKPPKANWIFAVLGAVILVAAYVIAVTIRSPLSALVLFFVAVLMVIAATYLLFISGSVALCKVLQKNKKYYYNKNHFVSVSSMSFRMKRNGAGLASICILCTMVLVMLASTSSLYIGMKDIIQSRFPHENEISVDVRSIDNLTAENTARLREEYDKVFTQYNAKPENVLEFRYIVTAGMLNGSTVFLTPEEYDEKVMTYDNLSMLYFIGVDCYNTLLNVDVSLKDGQALLYTTNGKANLNHIELSDVKLDIIGSVDESFKEKVRCSELTGSAIAPMVFVVSDFEQLRPLEGQVDISGKSLLTHHSYFGYDIDADDEKMHEIFAKVTGSLDNVEFIHDGEGGYSYSGDCIANAEADFYTSFGGLFFLGIILSAVFIFAAVMIIYYKQISEGYEDQKRFEIMQNIGMTDEDIKRNINSQVLTVFFAPLLLAGLHLTFAFPLVWKLLRLFGLNNLKLEILVNIAVFLIFSALYAVIYKITARAYYSIVSAKGKDKA